VVAWRNISIPWLTACPDLLSNVLVRSDSESRYQLRSPTAGPSGTCHNPQRQDSVIPPTQSDTQDSQQDLDRDQVSIGNTGSGLRHNEVILQPDIDVSKLNGWEEKYLRGELFQLLLSCLNEINQFSMDAYESDAEERMNHLLYQFWTNDHEVLRARLGERFPSVEAALENWMSMRHRLADFRNVTRYRGKPGDNWKKHLKQVGTVSHAQASIAFVKMRNASTREGLSAADSSFNDDLAMLFDHLTQVEGCNGEEEFGGLRWYNEALLEWFL
jgi:hypothetical protein